MLGFDSVSLSHDLSPSVTCSSLYCQHHQTLRGVIIILIMMFVWEQEGRAFFELRFGLILKILSLAKLFFNKQLFDVQLKGPPRLLTYDVAVLSGPTQQSRPYC